MNTYQVTFGGRTNGAIGIVTRHTLTIDAPNTKAAGSRIYETHEHISFPRFTLTHVDGIAVTPRVVPSDSENE